MRIEFQNSWVRLLVELWPRTVPIRRYRLTGENHPFVRRRIVRRLIRQIRHYPDFHE
jgi:hypothetical protein